MENMYMIRRAIREFMNRYLKILEVIGERLRVCITAKMG